MFASAYLDAKKGQTKIRRRWTCRLITSPTDMLIKLVHYEEVHTTPTGKQKIVVEWCSGSYDKKTRKLLPEPQIPKDVAQACVNSLVKGIKVEMRIGK